MKPILSPAACLILAACAAQPPASPAQAADAAACQAQAKAAYQQNTLSDAGHSAQPGLMFGATPTHVFDAEHMGAQSTYDSQVQDCEENGNNGQPANGPTPYVTPHIITN
jgi:hypothetical protein